MTLEGIGGQIRDSAEDGTTSVVTMRIADFINNVVAVRRCLYEPVSPSFTPTSLLFSPTHCQDLSRIPKGKGEELPPAVIMKLDVEGKVACLDQVFYSEISLTLFNLWAGNGGDSRPGSQVTFFFFDLTKKYPPTYKLAHLTSYYLSTSI